jgi:hypothetical protein
MAAFCAAELESWIDANAPHRGIHWTWGIELAIRLMNMVVIATLVGEHFTAAQRQEYQATQQAHALWLERYPSSFSSANNNRAAEGLGLFLVSPSSRIRPLKMRFSCRSARISI